MNKKEVKIIVTLGPATNTERDLRKIKDKGVDFVRINMSHSSITDLKYFIALSKKVDIPFIIYTEGSQVRSSVIRDGAVGLDEGDDIKIHSKEIQGDKHNISLYPLHIVSQLEEGDLLYIDFESLILRISDTTTFSKGYITAKALTSGILGTNKAVVIESADQKQFMLPPLSDKDYQSIKLGLKENIEHIAASFMRSGESVDVVRKATKNKMKIISKIECIDGLKNLDAIIEKSDMLLLDRGDMSKEIPIEKIPLAQKIILEKAREKNTDVFIATNFLETMINKNRPTRAEVHDVIATVLDGAAGVILSAETAIGAYPMECITMMKKLLTQAATALGGNHKNKNSKNITKHLEDIQYLLDHEAASSLIPPHGGVLINRLYNGTPDTTYVDSLQKIELNQDIQMDVEQIAVGTFSPLEGFMGKNELQSVLDTMRLPTGVIWTVPIVLNISETKAKSISIGDTVALEGDEGVMALLSVDEKYVFDKKELCNKMYGTLNVEHPGVKWVNSLQPIFLGGKIDLLQRRKSAHKEYELTPRQTRRLFTDRIWTKVVGFHTRNVIHRSHEFIQLAALEREHCDGLFIHPVIGKKKAGDYHSKYIIDSYEYMMRHVYPKDKVVFAAFSTFSRYAGPREAVFTAICRKNFGCSHFVVGRDHTGVGAFYEPDASHNIFDQFPDLGIKAVKFDKIFYSKKRNTHMHEKDSAGHSEEDKLHISGTEARKIFESGEVPPEWFMRPEISSIIIDSVKRGEEVFVKEKKGLVIWFTGLSGSGKTTIAQHLQKELEGKGNSVALIDGDAVRNNAHSHLGFSRKDIKLNNRLIAELARDKAKEFDIVLVSIISPYREDRRMAQSVVGSNFIELYVNSSLKTCIKRDSKGLYKMALAGEIDNFIGVSLSNPYEAPDNPDIEIKSDTVSVDEGVDELLSFLKDKKIL